MIARYTRNTYLFSIIAGFQAAWFVEAVWFFYWRIFATYTFIGVLFSIISILILILELPTGIFADKFGRKTATVLGSFILAIGGWGIALGTSIWWLLVGLIFQTVGRAFISGALEALVYDSLKADGKVDQYDQIATRKSQITTGVFAAAVIIGGFLYPVYFRLPHLLMGAVMTCSWIASLFLIEPPHTKILQSTLARTKDGLSALLKPQLKPFMLPAVTMLIVYFLYEWGFAKPAMAVHFGMNSSVQGLVFAVMALINIVIIGLLPIFRRKLGDSWGITLLNGMAGIGFVIAALPLGWWGILPMIGIEITTNLSEPWLSVIINKHIGSDYRATTLSALQLVGRIPYLIINLSFATFIDHGQSAQAFQIFGGGVLCVVCVSMLLHRHRFSQVTRSIRV